MEKEFVYEEAFSRNIGWLSPYEQQILRRKRVALAGLGGVGGSHVSTLARLGVGAFTIADFDVFELANFNRQAGAKMSTLNKRKIDVIRDLARDINPEADVKLFEKGLKEDQIDAFLADADIYVDSLDFFTIDLRRKIFARCAELGIPAVTAAPIGMGTAFLLFMPGGMTFEEWFRFGKADPAKHPVFFAVGLAPAGLHRSYLMDPSVIDFVHRRVPSTGLACDLCAGVAAAQVVKILLNRGSLEPVPVYHQFDAYTGRWKKGRMPWGNGNPIQRLKLAIGCRQFDKMARQAAPKPVAYEREIEKILDAARWAPSGDNMQPWRFEILDENRAVVHLHGAEDFYETVLRCKGILLAAGAFLESARLAASQYGRSLKWDIASEGEGYRLNVALYKDFLQKPDPLTPFIPIRSALRFPYRTTPLTPAQKDKLAKSLGDAFDIVWHEGFKKKLSASLINAAASAIRLRVPEAFPTHRSIIDWERDFSPTHVPAKGICMDPLARGSMRLVMKSWTLVRLMNATGGGIILPQIEMDLLPGLCCAAHFVIRFRDKTTDPTLPEALIRAGQAMQRFWLTATQEGLCLQPSFAALVYSLYADHPIGHAPFVKPARKLAAKVEAHAGTDLAHIAFLGRIGTPRTRRVGPRSIRRTLEELLGK